ncbi:hypothetical protein OX284_010420 [Flavobacterium sp. SUN046]|uniref:hypothetical protein n=1 Tax=Flavobacterium sp. SUN046 TaxID=3002440 RepID=UPI002DBB5CA0|nr:hypothetical protein [Flavobacterium sp. SUN046]MEC4049843.1 hypothetical protein [Flavobacterium sp. SUN046]
MKKDLYEEPIKSYNKNIVVKKFSINDIASKSNSKLNKSIDLIKSVLNNKTGKLVYNETYDFYFDDEEGVSVSKDGVISYTFPIYKDDGDTKIRNLIFVQNS